MLKHHIKVPDLINLGTRDIKYSWNVFNDTALGGKSVGHITYYDDYICYFGEIININNTGFSRLQSNKLEYNLSKIQEIHLKIKSDGRPYAFEMEFNHGWQHEKLGQLFQSSRKDEWETVILKITDFKVVKFKEVIGSSYNSKLLRKILRFNFYVAEKIEGPFKLEIASISFIPKT